MRMSEMTSLERQKMAGSMELPSLKREKEVREMERKMPVPVGAGAAHVRISGGKVDYYA